MEYRYHDDTGEVPRPVTDQLAPDPAATWDDTTRPAVSEVAAVPADPVREKEIPDTL